MTDPHHAAAPVEPVAAPTTPPSVNPAPTGYAGYAPPAEDAHLLRTEVYHAPQPAPFPSAVPPPAALTTPLRSTHDADLHTVAYPPFAPMMEAPASAQTQPAGIASAVQRFPLGLAALVLIPIGVVATTQPRITVALVVAALAVAWRFEPRKRMANLLTAVGALLVGLLITWPSGSATTSVAAPLPVPTPTVVKSFTSTVTITPTPSPTASTYPYGYAPTYPYGYDLGATGQVYPTQQPFGQRPKKNRPAPPLDRVITEEEDDTGASYSTCEQVRAAGRAPIYRGQPGWSSVLDPDGDGVACDKKRDV